MNRMNVSFSITAEDKVRLTALAEAMRVSESEVLHHLLARDYQSWEEDVITNQDSDLDEAS